MIEIRKVSTKRELKQFIQFYYDLYRDSKQAVPYLYFDEKATLRHDKNPSFECCEADYFLALRDGKVVGRVAAIINRRANEQWHGQQVRFGWFDFIDDQEVSKALLDAVAEWGRERGMTEMSGPLGFIDTDREGMLIDGFDELSTMYVNYNYPYYPKHIENMGGFRKDNDYVELRVKVPEDNNYKFHKIALMVEKRYGLRGCKCIEPDADAKRHCMADRIRFCSAPCLGKISPEEYRERFNEACSFLRGDRPQVIGELVAEMESAAAENDFDSSSTAP